MLSLAFLCVAFVLHGILVHIVPLMRDKGLDPDMAALVASAMGATVCFSRILSGYLIDHFFAPGVALVFFALIVIKMLGPYPGIKTFPTGTHA